MNKKLKNILIPLISALVLFGGCTKDDEIAPAPTSNPTNGKSTAVFNSSVTYGTLTDQDGNIYKTITIGTQTWMAENLRTTKYNNGTEIKPWDNSVNPAYSNYNNTSSYEAIATFGRLYNWYAVNTGKLAPKGWHIPTEAEWLVLIDYLGDQPGAKLKETGLTHWMDPNIGATNETGFTGISGGLRGYNDKFFDLGSIGSWWSSSDSDTDLAKYFSLNTNEVDVGNYTLSKQVGSSVRCIKD